jgi:hypothetical protein
MRKLTFCNQKNDLISRMTLLATAGMFVGKRMRNLNIETNTTIHLTSGILHLDEVKNFAYSKLFSQKPFT